MGFEQLINKYSPETSAAGVEEQEPGISCGCPVIDQEPEEEAWRDSKPTVALSDHLKSRPDHGVWLVLKDGGLALHFRPSLKRADQDERWTFAAEAADLLQDAREDLGIIVELGLLNLPQM